MTRFEFREHMLAMGCISHEQMARAIGVTRSTVSLWLSGRVPVPLPIAMLVRLMAEEKTVERA